MSQSPGVKGGQKDAEGVKRWHRSKPARRSADSKWKTTRIKRHVAGVR